MNELRTDSNLTNYLAIRKVERHRKDADATVNQRGFEFSSVQPLSRRSGREVKIRTQGMTVLVSRVERYISGTVELLPQTSIRKYL